MTDPDRLLADLWAADEPPARDPGFVLQVIERVERRRLWLELGGLVSTAFAAGLALWALAPAIDLAVRRLAPAPWDPALMTLAGAGLMAAWLWAAVSGSAGPFRA
jgi:hypothetical protein